MSGRSECVAGQLRGPASNEFRPPARREPDQRFAWLRSLPRYRAGRRIRLNAIAATPGVDGISRTAEAAPGPYGRGQSCRPYVRKAQAAKLGSEMGRRARHRTGRVEPTTKIRSS
jgi:hypothetical protein